MSKEAKTEKKEEPKYSGMNIHQRLHAVMTQVDYVQKTKANGKGLQYNSVSHDAVTAAVRKPCVEWGVHYYPSELTHSVDGNRTSVSLKIRFVNIDSPSDFVETPSFGYGIDNQDKGPGKAISYAVKYALLKSFGLETGDDPDNDNINHVPNAKSEADVKAAQAFGGSMKSNVHPDEIKVMYDQALYSLGGCADFDSLKKVWANYWKTKDAFAIDQWADIEQKYQECKTQLNGVQF